ITGTECGIVDYWLHTVRELYSRHRDELGSLPLDEQVDRMCELNVKNQVATLTQTKIIQRAWLRGQPLSVHGWVYGLSDGRVTDLNCTISGLDQVAQLYRVDRLDPVPQQD
ncbi:MAG: carbonic anhydrase, partial [Halomonas sp.]|nr:carbonic anhydrase [Halomonas sp.]